MPVPGKRGRVVMSTFADLAEANPNVKEQYETWRDLRAKNGEDPTQWQAFRQHVPAIGAPDPGAQATHERVLRFSWPDPMGHLPETWVVVLFHDRGPWTLVELEHYGFGRGDDWDAAYVSAARAWSGYLKNLRSVLGGGLDLRED